MSSENGTKMNALVPWNDSGYSEYGDDPYAASAYEDDPYAETSAQQQKSRHRRRRRARCLCLTADVTYRLVVLALLSTQFVAGAILWSKMAPYEADVQHAMPSVRNIVTQLNQTLPVLSETLPGMVHALEKLNRVNLTAIQRGAERLPDIEKKLDRMQVDVKDATRIAKQIESVLSTLSNNNRPSQPSLAVTL